MKTSTKPQSLSQSIQRAAAKSNDRLITPANIRASTPAAAARALARLASSGKLVRAARGIYYAPAQTALGQTTPPQLAVLKRRFQGRYRPVKSTAANLLGLSTQIPAKPEIVLYATAMPTPAPNAKIRLRRGSQPLPLTELEGAFLELLRERAAYAEASPDHIISALLNMLKAEPQGFSTTSVCTAVLSEPPRVRALLGALLQEAGLHGKFQQMLKSSLNPLSLFPFGIFSRLSTAKSWQSK